MFDGNQKIDAKFEGKLTCTFKNDMKNLPNFHRQKMAISLCTEIGKNQNQN